MKQERIYALFRNFEDASSAINDLTNNGYDGKHISVVTSDSEGRFARHLDADDVNIDGEEAAGFGALTGALVGLGVMAIPGIGPIMAAGPFAAALAGLATGAVAGAATGGIVGTLIDWGTSEEDANRYQQVLVDGGALVIADSYNNLWDNDRIEAIFHKYHAVNVEDYDLS